MSIKRLLWYRLGWAVQVKWSTRGSISRAPPTCVLVHGIMGSRRNMLNFALRLTRVRTWLTCLRPVEADLPSYFGIKMDGREHSWSPNDIIMGRQPRPQDVVLLAGSAEEEG